MPWNVEKVKAELGRRWIPKGLQQVLSEFPQLAFDAAFEIITDDESTSAQRINSLRWLRELAFRRFVTKQPARFVSALRGHLSSSDSEVRLTASESMIHFAFYSRHYVGFEAQANKRGELLEEALAASPEILEGPYVSLVNEIRRSL